MAIATTSNVKAILGIPAGITVKDTLIGICIEAADQIVLDHLGLTSTSVTTVNEKIDIEELGQREVALNRRPVVSVAALTISGSLEATSNYYVTEYGSLRMINEGAYFPTGRQNVEVTYTAGFSSVPKDVVHAANLIAVQMVNEGQHTGYQSERMGAYNYTMGTGQYSMVVRRILGKYTRVFARP